MLLQRIEKPATDVFPVIGGRRILVVSVDATLKFGRVLALVHFKGRNGKAVEQLRCQKCAIVVRKSEHRSKNIRRNVAHAVIINR